MKILVTGGAGYLGSVIIPALLAEGHAVTTIDNFMYEQTSLLDVCQSDLLTIIRGDAADEILIKPYSEAADVLIPLACLTGAPLCDKEPKQAEVIIIDALRYILKNKRPEQIVIYPTTNSGYGVGEPGKHCTEETPLRPISLYGKLKVQAEKEVLEAGNSITFRLATAFGVSPRMRLDLLVNDFTFRAVHEGHIKLFEAHFKRNFIHVRDIAKAFVHSINNFDSMKNNTYNVGLSDANLSKWELCEEIKKQVPSFSFDESHDGEDPDKRDYIVSNEKIEKTGFKPDVSLSAGIGELIKGYEIIPQTRNARTQLTNV